MKILSILIGALRAFFWFTLLFALDRPYLAVLTLLSILIHEGGHVLAFLFLSRGARMKTHLCGLRLSPTALLSYEQERFVAAAGPICGGIAALLSFAFGPLAPGYMPDFALCNLLTSLSNLLPIEGYDGYRILSASAALRGRESRLLPALSFGLCALLSLLSLFLFGILGEGLWTSAVFLFSLLSALPEQKNTISEDFGEKRRIREISREN